MATMTLSPESNELRAACPIDDLTVVHPLFDVAEQKCSSEGRIRLTRPVRLSLGVLRAYLIAMTLMLGYHVLDLAGLLHRSH
jgi:hypothetical protein